MRGIRHVVLILPARDTDVITKTLDVWLMGGAAWHEQAGMCGMACVASCARQGTVRVAWHGMA
jgi:hypothetical protein